MARASVSPGTSRTQTTDDVRRVVSDDPCTAPAAPPRVPDGLPYAEVDILARGADHYIAGGALLAEVVRHVASDRQDRGERPEAGAEGIIDAALEQERQLLAELSSPGQDLADVVVKLAYAWRCAWWGNHSSSGTYGGASLELVASALSDVILMREAEAQRRYKLGERGA